MNRLKQMSLALATTGVLASGAAQAALFDRGGGLLYDDVLNVTWLQDANYAKTSGYDADGLMSWSAAKAWADGLVYGGYDDWRLAANTPVGADWNYGYATDGSTDYGFNITSPHSELSYMYYVNLGLKGFYDTSGIYQSTWGIFGNGTFNGIDNGSFGQNDVGSVKNLQSSLYWSGTAYAPNPPGFAWYVGIYYGFQNLTSPLGEYYAWAVRPGDVATPIPEPETYAMLLAGLGLLGVAVKRRRQSFAA